MCSFIFSIFFDSNTKNLVRAIPLKHMLHPVMALFKSLPLGGFFSSYFMRGIKDIWKCNISKLLSIFWKCHLKTMYVQMEQPQAILLFIKKIKCLKNLKKKMRCKLLFTVHYISILTSVIEQISFIEIFFRKFLQHITLVCKTMTRYQLEATVHTNHNSDIQKLQLWKKRITIKK